MEWITAIKETLRYIENNLLTVKGAEEAAKNVAMSPLYLQQGFQMLTGFTVSDYVKKRRLYLAALELARGDISVIDAAYKYGYQTPESFCKAFSRFHGATPSEVKKGKAVPKQFFPLKVHVQIQGGNEMEFKVEKMPDIKVVGVVRQFSSETSYEKIPQFWDEFMAKYFSESPDINLSKAEFEEFARENRIGKLGICFDDEGGGKFDYMIGGFYRGGKVPRGFEVRKLPETSWAKFRCYGALPEALQSVNTQIWREWLPGNFEYELSGHFNVEWYSTGDPSSAEYVSELWFPVKKIERNGEAK